MEVGETVVLSCSGRGRSPRRGKVREDGVVAAVHAGLAPEPWKTLDLDGLLGG
jgi:hypothetical protein